MLMDRSCSQDFSICTIIIIESKMRLHQIGKQEMDICLVFIFIIPRNQSRDCVFWHHNFKLCWIKIPVFKQRIFPLKDAVQIPLDPKLKMLPGPFGFYIQEGQQAKNDWCSRPCLSQKAELLLHHEMRSDFWIFGTVGIY